jgi:hypothetical protein
MVSKWSVCVRERGGRREREEEHTQTADSPVDALLFLFLLCCGYKDGVEDLVVA